MSTELLKTKELRTAPNANAPMAARAVALCEGCPMARFCTAKGSGDCPPNGSGNEKVFGSQAESRASYMSDLYDDSVGFVGMNKIKPKLLDIDKLKIQEDKQKELVRREFAIQKKREAKLPPKPRGDTVADMAIRLVLNSMLPKKQAVKKKQK